MSLFRDHIAPYMIEYSMTRPFWAEYRRRVLQPAIGDVLEIGFGTGVNLGFYPASVSSLTLLEPDKAMLARARARLAAWPGEASIVDGTAEALPFPDKSFDTAVSTLTLCSVSDPEQALHEIRRVLKPGGSFLFLEHGLADDPKISRWQNRLNGVCSLLSCGCNLNRDMSALIRQAGFARIDMMEDYAPGMPKVSGLLTEGLARAI